MPFYEDDTLETESIVSNTLNEINSISMLKRRIRLAKGQEKVDLVVKNANIVNVFSGDIHRTDVAVAEGIFVGFGEGYETKNTFDAQGKFMCPGLIDGHIHLESSFLSPKEFCNVVALHGTSAVICDPHEIANVLGLRGIDYILETTNGLPVKIYLMMPSCVPVTPLESSGAKILEQHISNYVNRYSDRIIGLGEMMNYPGVLSEDEQTLSKLLAVGYRPKDGHAPLLSGKSLSAYIIAGLGSDHECSRLSEALEKLRNGMHIMIREGTQEKNLLALVPLINEYNSCKISLISDDRDPIDLKENGHLDYLVRRAISYGVAPIRAIQMTSINTARYFGLKDQGAIAPGFRADFILLDDLKSFEISTVFIDGMDLKTEIMDKDNISNGVISKSNYYYDRRSRTSAPVLIENTMHVKSLDNDHIFRIPSRGSLIQVIGVVVGQIITEKRIVQAKLDGGFAVADPQKDLAKLVVIERHHKLGNISFGFVQGMGLEKGAIVSSVAHDSHNLVVAGMNDIDMLTAARHICSIGGGLAVACNGRILADLPLPIAGLMSDKPIDLVVSKMKTINDICRKLGNKVIRDPFMLLSFLSLPVIPSLKLTDKGLFDVTKFQLTNLWVQ